MAIYIYIYPVPANTSLCFANRTESHHLYHQFTVSV